LRLTLKIFAWVRFLTNVTSGVLDALDYGGQLIAIHLAIHKAGIESSTGLGHPRVTARRKVHNSAAGNGIHRVRSRLLNLVLTRHLCGSKIAATNGSLACFALASSAAWRGRPRACRMVVFIHRRFGGLLHDAKLAV
jgi:hypothetical protein